MNFKEVADIVLGASQADETEIVYRRLDGSLTRFANNHIHRTSPRPIMKSSCVAFPDLVVEPLSQTPRTPTVCEISFVWHWILRGSNPKIPISKGCPARRRFPLLPALTLLLPVALPPHAPAASVSCAAKQPKRGIPLRAR